MDANSEKAYMTNLAQAEYAPNGIGSLAENPYDAMNAVLRWLEWTEHPAHIREHWVYFPRPVPETTAKRLHTLFDAPEDDYTEPKNLLTRAAMLLEQIEYAEDARALQIYIAGYPDQIMTKLQRQWRQWLPGASEQLLALHDQNRDKLLVLESSQRKKVGRSSGRVAINACKPFLVETLSDARKVKVPRDEHWELHTMLAGVVEDTLIEALSFIEPDQLSGLVRVVERVCANNGHGAMLANKQAGYAKLILLGMPVEGAAHAVGERPSRLQFKLTRLNATLRQQAEVVQMAAEQALSEATWPPAAMVSQSTEPEPDDYPIDDTELYWEL